MSSPRNHSRKIQPKGRVQKKSSPEISRDFFLKQKFTLLRKKLRSFPCPTFKNLIPSRQGSSKMAAKVKPVQPTEIKDKKIALQVIEHIRKPIPASVYRKHEKIAAYIDKAFHT
jgi:hypothetical protein